MTLIIALVNDGISPNDQERYGIVGIEEGLQVLVKAVLSEEYYARMWELSTKSLQDSREPPRICAILLTETELWTDLNDLKL